MRMLQLLRKSSRYIGDTYRKYGAAAAIHDIVYRGLNTLGHFEVLRGMTVRVQDVTDPELFEAPGFDARFATVDELMKLADGSYDLTAEFLEEARMRGDRCYALFEGEKLASYGWYSELPTPVDSRLLLRFDRVWTYMYKGYTMPAYRGKRLHAVGMCRALRAFTEEGKMGLISYVLSNNFASMKSITRMGYRIFGDVYIFRAGGRSFMFATPGCHGYGFRVESPEADMELTWSQ